MQLSNEQIRSAALVGVRLLSSRKQVRVPGNVAVTGEISVLFALLQNIVSGALVVVSGQAVGSVGNIDVPSRDKDGTEDIDN